MSDSKDKNIEKLLQIRLFDVLLFHMKGNIMQFLRNSFERVVYNKMLDLQPENAIKTNSLASSFQRFCLLFSDS